MERLSTSSSKPAMTTKQHNATPEQWDDAGAFSSDTRACLLELRARVEWLEATQRPPHQDKLDRLIALDRDDDGEPIVLPGSPAGLLVERVLALQDQIRDGALTLVDAVKEIGGKTTMRPLVEDDGFTVDGWHKDGEFRGQGDTCDGQFYINGELAKTGGIWQHVAIVASRGAFQFSPTANSLKSDVHECFTGPQIGSKASLAIPLPQTLVDHLVAGFPCLDADQARAVILVVAARLREQAPDPGPIGKMLGQVSTPFEVMADVLEQEANP
jgi:hypothetical protein